MGLLPHRAVVYPGLAPGGDSLCLGARPRGQTADAAFFCTDLQATPEQILQWVVMRWSVEVTFEEARAHLGVETQRQWSDSSHCPHYAGPVGAVLPGDRAGAAVVPQRADPGETAAWYHKAEPTFSDCLTLVRRHLWRARYLVNSAPQAEFVQLPREAFEVLLNDLPLAA